MPCQPMHPSISPRVICLCWQYLPHRCINDHYIEATPIWHSTNRHLDRSAKNIKFLCYSSVTFWAGRRYFTRQGIYTAKNWSSRVRTVQTCANINKRWMHEESQLKVKALSGPWVAKECKRREVQTFCALSYHVISILRISLAVNVGSSKRTARHVRLHTCWGAQSVRGCYFAFLCHDVPSILNKEVCNVTCIAASTHHFQVCRPDPLRALCSSLSRFLCHSATRSVLSLFHQLHRA